MAPDVGRGPLYRPASIADVHAARRAATARGLPADSSPASCYLTGGILDDILEVTHAVNDLEMGGMSATALAMGGALAREMSSQIPDWDIWETDGLLASVRRLHPDDPHAMAAVVGAWEDARVKQWAAERAAHAQLVGGLENSVLAAALLGKETGLALLSGAGRPRAVAWRGAPLATYTASQVMKVVDDAVEEATRRAAVGSAAGRTVSAAAGTAHVDVWGAVGQSAPGDVASLGTRFSWFAAQVAQESANPVTVGAVAQVLLLGMMVGMGLPLAARRGDGPSPGSYLEALTARAAAPSLVLAGVTKGDVEAALSALGWAGENQRRGRLGAGESDAPARGGARASEAVPRGGMRAPRVHVTEAAGSRAGDVGSGGGGGGAEAGSSVGVSRGSRLTLRAPEATVTPDGNAGSDGEPADASTASATRGKESGRAHTFRGPTTSPDHPYYLAQDEHRDAAGKPRCRFFAKDGTCRQGQRCTFSHEAAARQGSRV